MPPSRGVVVLLIARPILAHVGDSTTMQHRRLIYSRLCSRRRGPTCLYARLDVMYPQIFSWQRGVPSLWPAHSLRPTSAASVACLQVLFRSPLEFPPPTVRKTGRTRRRRPTLSAARYARFGNHPARFCLISTVMIIGHTELPAGVAMDVTLFLLCLSRDSRRAQMYRCSKDDIGVPMQCTHTQ